MTGSDDPQPITTVKVSERQREATLLYQQKVAALVECARDFALFQSYEALMNLLKVALEFDERIDS